MVDKSDDKPKCGQCKEVRGCVFLGMVYCAWLNQDVYAGSLMCEHGRDTLEIF